MLKNTIAGSSYGFSATRINSLGAAEYTLVTIAADVSGSVSGFEKDIERAIKEVVKACRHSPRADNLMLRLVMFDHSLVEIHGFKPLMGCDPSDYDGCLHIGGTTALFDAAHNAVAAVAQYGKDLSDNDFEVNGIVFVMTDGLDNASSMKPAGRVEHALASKRLHTKCGLMIAEARGLASQIYSDLCAGVFKQPIMRTFIDIDCQKAVLECVAAENIGNLRTDNNANTKIQKCP